MTVGDEVTTGDRTREEAAPRKGPGLLLAGLVALLCLAVSYVFPLLSALLLAWAYARAEAQILAPVEYTAFVWAACLGYAVFGEHVSVFTLAGAALIIAGCVVAVRRPAPGPQSEAGL